MGHIIRTPIDSILWSCSKRTRTSGGYRVDEDVSRIERANIT